MNTKFSLTFGMCLFSLIIFTSFALIIYKEKDILLVDRIDQKLTTYFNNNYKSIKSNVKLKKTIYNNNLDCYEKKIVFISSKQYFYIYYKNKNITDTYKEAN